VKLAKRYDLMIVSTKGVSVTAARRLIDEVCGNYDLPLFVLHDFDLSGFVILGTLQRDTRRYKFSSTVEVIDLGLRLDDIAGLEREPAAPSKVRQSILREQLAENGALDAEIEILLNQRVELNALTSGDLVAMIERKLRAYGLEKVIPDEGLLAKTYRAVDRSYRLREKFKEMEQQFDKEAAATTDIPEDLKQRVHAILAEYTDLRWDDAIQCVLDPKLLSHVRSEKGKAQRKSGDFTSDGE
jgi:Topoisomerase 6 subunit A/Spo11, Toprim domain